MFNGNGCILWIGISPGTLNWWNLSFKVIFFTSKIIFIQSNNIFWFIFLASFLLVLNFNVFCIINYYYNVILKVETPQPTWTLAKFKNKHDHLIKDEFPFPFLKAFILRQFKKYIVKLQLGTTYLLGIRETIMIL